MSPRLSVLRWLRIFVCVAAGRLGWRRRWSCGYADCPRCKPHVAQREEGEALYREWLEAERKLGQR